MRNPYSGLFVVLEGIDGAGKSTLANNLYLALKKLGKDCLVTFEPTKGKWGSLLRQSFLASERLSPREELDLFRKDRREHVENVIMPALKEGRIVICDRYFFSTAAYQGARGLNPKKILAECRLMSIEPDLCLFLEIEPDEAVRRIRLGRGEEANNFEQLDYLKNVARIYTEIRNGCIPLDARLPVERLRRDAMKLIILALESRI